MLCLALCLRCTSVERATRVTIELDAEPELRSRIAHVDLAFYTAISQDAWRMRSQERLRTEGSGAWPLQWSFSRSRTQDQRYSLEARALDEHDDLLAELRAVGEFREEGTVHLTRTFDASCTQACAEGRTCRDGACVDAEVTPTTAAGEPGAEVDASGGSNTSSSAPPLTACGDAGECVSECGPDHGGCDPSVSCKLERGVPRCGVCPDGFEQQSGGQCRALLQQLQVQGAALEPDFRPDHTEYTLELGLLAKSWSLTPIAAANAQLMLNNAPLSPGSAVTPQSVAAGEDRLTIEVAGPGGEGRAYQFALRASGEELAFLKAPTPMADAHFGHRAVLDGDTLAVSADGEDSSARGINPENPARDGAANSGAVYVYRRRDAQWELQAYIKASDSSEGASFGKSIALDGDTLVVGAFKDQDRGAAYVFERDGDSWREQVKLVPDEESQTQFGQSVTVRGELLIVGAPTYNFGGSASGVTFVYRKQPADGSWVFERKLGASQPMALTWFGSSVTLGGDYLVVGATGEGNGSVASGTAYVFRSDTFEPIDTLRPSTASATAFFGERSAIAGDTIAVAAFNTDAGFANGLVYIFDRTADGSFEQTTALQAANASAGDQFGTAIALTDDYLLVGAAHESSGTRGINGSLSSPALENSGAAYLFARTAAGFNQVAHIKAKEPAAGAQLGYDVSISGGEIVVSADSDPRAATGSGAVHLFR